MAKTEEPSRKVELHLLTFRKGYVNIFNNVLNIYKYKLAVNTKPSIVTTNRISAYRNQFIRRIFASPCPKQPQR